MTSLLYPALRSSTRATVAARSAQSRFLRMQRVRAAGSCSARQASAHEVHAWAQSTQAWMQADTTSGKKRGSGCTLIMLLMIDTP